MAMLAASVIFRAVAFVSLVAVESAQTSGMRKHSPFSLSSMIDFIYAQASKRSSSD
jgi:hypothetical protein